MVLLSFRVEGNDFATETLRLLEETKTRLEVANKIIVSKRPTVIPQGRLGREILTKKPISAVREKL